jgi:ribosomal protein S25
MLVFVGCNYERLPFLGYRDVFREVAAAEPRIEFVFADARISNQSILQKVRENILNCDVGLYDVTFRNPNVMMELGIAIGAGRHWNILYNPEQDLSVERRGWFARPRSNAEIPANLRGYEYLEYRDRLQLGERLTEWAKQTLERSSREISQRWAKHAVEVLDLLKVHPDLSINEVATRSGIEVSMARLAITGLRKKGLVQTNGRRGVATRYRLSTPARGAPHPGRAVPPVA